MPEEDPENEEESSQKPNSGSGLHVANEGKEENEVERSLGFDKSGGLHRIHIDYNYNNFLYFIDDLRLYIGMLLATVLPGWARWERGILPARGSCPRRGSCRAGHAGA